MDEENATEADREKRAFLISAAFHDERGTIAEVLFSIKERFGMEPYELYLRTLVHLQWIGKDQLWDVSNHPNWPDMLRFLATKIEGQGTENGVT